MSVSLFDITSLRGPLEEGAVVLTANRRIRAKILEAYAAYKRECGEVSWTTPCVYSFEGWLSSQLERAAYIKGSQDFADLILSDDRELALWRQVISASKAEHGVINMTAAATDAAKAYRVSKLWMQDLQSQDFDETDATRSFADWAARFESVCRALGAMPKCLTGEKVLSAYREGVLRPQSSIRLVGFDDIPPLHQALLDQACEELIAIDHQCVADNTNELFCAPEPSDELRAAAHWARQIAQKDPEAVVGIIDPALGQRRNQVFQTFMEVLDPHQQRHDINQYAPPFNISMGEALNTFPLVQVAFAIWDLNRFRVSMDTIQRLLHTPLIGGYAHERQARLKVWSRINKSRVSSMTTGQLRDQMADAEDLQARVDTVKSTVLDGSRRLPSEWSDILYHQLTAAGWPGDYDLCSYEFQVGQMLLSILQEFADYDPLTEHVSFSEALSIVHRLAGNRLFQPETKDSTVQILGSLEGAGLTFDYLWVVGMRSDQWPAAAAPTPYIPLHIQREHEMPNATPERELEFARSLTHRFATSARHVVFSYPASDGDNELTASQLVSHLPHTDAQQLGIDGADSSLAWASGEGARVLTRDDSLQGKGITSADGPAPGGTSLFKDYAQCSFRGFLRHRLGVRSPEQPEEGVDRATRGQLTHLMLKYIWDELKDHASLCAIIEQPQQLEELLERCATAAVDQWSHGLGSLVGRVRDLEIRRLCAVSTQWLNQELQRSPFRVVETESDEQTEIGPVTIKQKRDRVDELLDSGELFAIDYKENAPTLTSWRPDTMSEPQLPISVTALVTAGSDVGGAGFITLNRDKQSVTGVAAVRDAVPGTTAPEKLPWVCDSLASLHAQWQESLEAIAERISEGRADIDPDPQFQACRECEMASVCRLHLREI